MNNKNDLKKLKRSNGIRETYKKFATKYEGGSKHTSKLSALE